MTSPRPDDLFASGHGEGEDESWLTSYLDVLTLLITLFVLLLALSGNQPGDADATGTTALSASGAAASTAGSRTSGIQPRQTGLLPHLDGVSVSRSQEGLNLRIQDHLLFASGQATLTEAGRQVLRGILPLLESTAGAISVEGHTDDVPIHTPRYPSNWELSSARASAVLRFLDSQGVAIQRLRAVGYAATRPLADNHDPSGRATNRRVELVIHEAKSGPD
ncbi:OmpA/MotB family protein [Modicisalibacter radicis]|uniref:OmpA/MotB family protein n=1 Tax=Halomonas sp. EAR18 TaxID=2518972 RepID=UPI00109D6EC6|nr:OmpA family protein [Halomonas sp. EAR18]